MRSPVPMLVLCAITLVASAPPALAVEKSGKKGGDVPALYRYRNADGVLVMERSIPPEYTTKGYEVLNAFGQVIQTVAPVTLLTEEERKARAEVEATSSRKDSELRKLYSSPQDAERLRDRQLEALGLKVEHARGQLSQTSAKRKTAVEEAARMERAGNKVPPAKRETIERLTLQVNAQEQEIRGLQQEQVRVREQFDPIIARLRVIYPDKAGTPAPVAGTGMPAPSAAPAVPTPGKPVAPVPAAVQKPASTPAAPVTGKVAAPTPAPAPVPAKPAQPVPSPAPAPVAKPAVAPVQPPPPALAAPAKPAPVAPAPQKPVAAPPAKPAVAAAPPPKPAVPPVAPVSKPQAKTAASNKATEQEKSAAKAKAKAEMGLEEEPRPAGGLRPTGF